MQEERMPEALIGRIPLRERNAFQIYLLQRIMGDKPPYKTDEVWSEEKTDLAVAYGGKISEIIDAEANADIRRAIMRGEYAAAAAHVAEMLGMRLAA